ncbi:MAG: hypothetical protein AAF560_05420 [Acidobacteriota bacterium]
MRSARVRLASKPRWPRPANLAALLNVFVLTMLGFVPYAEAATPPVPNQPTPACDATLGGTCYVNGSFTITASSPGAHHYKVCRSNDTVGWGGCNVVMTHNTGPTFTISGSNLPGDGFRRAYYFSACDSANNCTSWGDNTPAYVTMDATGPTQPGPTTVSCSYAPAGECWVTGSFNASVTPSTDSGSGVDAYQICRSLDSAGGWAGCSINLSLNGGPSINVSGSHLPAAGSRRAYYFRAKDHVGNWGPWNVPRYVRIDRNNPTVSATNASPDWFNSRTATIAAVDATGGAAANSGLAQVRYRWNAAHNAGCTSGTVTSSGATLTVPEGDNTLYLCARDNTGRVGFWSGQYRVDDSPPTQPGPTSVACAYAPTGECWVTGDFTISAAPSSDPSGIDGYQICRSQDSPGGWAGCNVNLDLDGDTSILVTGSHLASPGFRRAYYFRAKDNTGTWGPWNVPRYVRIDRNNPTVSATNASPEWFESRTATLTAADIAGGAGADSGLADVRYRWNTPLNAACTNGTATSSGATLTVPEGDNTLYLCARDNTGRVGSWNGQYRVDSGPPTQPGPTSVACAYAPPGECWVTGDFTISVAPSTDPAGIDGYQICRSQDSPGGWAGCNVNLDLDGGTSTLVSGSHLPSPSFRRAYYFRAKDNAGTWGPWNVPRYVRVDRDNPSVSASNASSDWFQNRTATLSAHDEVGGVGANTGLAELRYRWNTGLNAACTNGTATSSGTTLTVPEGDNTLYLCARDNAGRVGTWNGQYRVDNTAPSRDSITVSSSAWSINDGSTYDIVAKASDAASGVRELRTLINFQGSNTANPRGNFSWRDESLGYLWSADRVPCTGGGFASKHPTSFNPSTITLVGCSTSLAGGQRTVTFTVRPNATFGEFGPINDISLWARDFELHALYWLNFELNFSSFINTTPPRLVVSSPPDGPLPQHGEVNWGEVEPGSGTGNQITRTIRVENGAASGASNLLLEGSPSNVEVVNTQGNAFSWTGALDSPLSPGQQDDFEVHMSTSQTGTFKAQLRIWHNDFVRPVPLRIELEGTVAAPEPVVDSVDRSPVLQGQQKIIIVHGQNLQGASVSVGTGAPDEGDPPPNRVYPTAELVTINAAGTRLEARINATAQGVEGFYNLGIETPSGATGAQFRVVGPEPIIDMWTPSEPVAGRVHVLQIAGVNLQNADVTPMSSGVKILDLDNSEDQALSGLIFIGNGVPPGAIDLRIDGQGGTTMLPLIPRSKDSESTKVTHKLDTTGARPGQPTPHIYIQDPVSPHSGSDLLAMGYGLGDDFEKSVGTEELAAAEKGISFCFSIGARRIFSYSAILLSLSDSLGDPLTQQALNALLPGQSLDFNSLTVAITGFIEFEFFFRICDSGVTDLRFCIRGGIGVMVPAIGGWSIGFDICFGLNQQDPLPAEGSVNTQQWTTDNNCVRAVDDFPASILGERQGTLLMDCCDEATIGLRTSGVAFNRAFNVEGPVAEVMPEACTPPNDSQLELFLDVDNDNPFDPNNAVPINDLDDLHRYVPGSKLDGSSVPNLMGSPQQMKLVAAYVELEAGGVRVVPPPAGVTSMEFALSDTSAFVGVAGNWPISGGSTAPDFDFGSGSLQRTVNFASDHTARVDFVAYDYGGITTVEASPDGGATREVIRVPRDDNNNLVPDACWRASGTSISCSNLTAQNDRDGNPMVSGPPNFGLLGDGLSVYEEYRGFVVNGMHKRLDPTQKDFFIHRQNIGGALDTMDFQDVGTGFVSSSGLTIHEILREEMTGTAVTTREINRNFENHGGGASGDIPGRKRQTAVLLRFEDVLTGDPATRGDTPTQDRAPSVPNRVIYARARVNRIEDTEGLFSTNSGLLLNVIRYVAAHELGHAVHLCHVGPVSGGAPGDCPDGAMVPPMPDVRGNFMHNMHSGLFEDLADRRVNGNLNFPSTYHPRSIQQIRLHKNDENP